MKLLSMFRQSEAGNVGITFGLATLPVIGLIGAAVDYSRSSVIRTSLQEAADNAALTAAAARVATDQERITVAQRFFSDGSTATVTTTPTGAAATDDTAAGVNVTVNGRSVSVSVTRQVRTSILSVLGINDISVSAQATAVRVNKGPPVCVLALNQTASGAVTFSGSSSFVAEGCAIYSNSSSGSALVLQGSATAKADGFCSVGGASVTSSITPQPQTYCERVDDPYRNLPQPASNGCDYNKTSVGPGTQATLSPGVYCNGLDLKGTATLKPGLYIIKSGTLSISSQANVSGSGITFYLTGQNAGFTINGGSGISLGAMTSGAYAGLLIVQDRAANAGGSDTLNGTSDTVLTGAIYTPTQSLTVSGNGSFGQQTRFMPIIADQVKFTGSSTTRTDLTAITPVQPLPQFPAGAVLTN